MPPRPLISCLMVTADRPALAQRAICSFEQQTYPNKELVVLDNGSTPMRQLLEHLPTEQVRYEHVERGPTTVIGGLRNQSLEMAGGSLIVPQWDDDDWSHPERLERQFAALESGPYDAVVLQGTLMHVDTPEYAMRPFLGTLKGGVPPTILHRRSSDIRYPDLRRTSDTHYVNAWQERPYHVMPREQSHLYVRYQHGGNLWEAEHFLRRMRNTPRDLLAYGYYRFVRRDLFSHPRFRLWPEAKQAFELYIDDTQRFDLLQSEPAASAPPSR